MNARDEIRQYVKKVLRENKQDDGPVGDTDSLVLSGRLNSLDVMDLLLFLETRFGLSIEPAEFDQVQFDTVESITQLVGKT